MSRLSPPLRSLAVVLVLGVGLGVAWSLLVDTPTVTRDARGLVTAGTELGKRIDADAWFAVLGAVGSALVGVLALLTGLLGRQEPVRTTLAAVATSVAASVLCWLVGRLLGPGDPTAALTDAAVGATAPEQLTVHTWVVFLVWPLAASLGALVALLLRPATGPTGPIGPTHAPTRAATPQA